VFDTGEKSGAELIDILGHNFEGEETFRRRLARCPRFGNDNEDADELSADLARFVCEEFLRHTPWRGGRFLPSCIMFETYGPEGRKVGATPDGRLAGQPLADSIGPHQGRDVQGPTAMLRSVTKLPLHLFAGTPVVNIRFTKDLFVQPESRRRIREMLETYFAMGGLQIQVSVIDQAVLQDAMEHPERHEDLIVRIGGYSTYFNALSQELKEAVLERSAHAV
jgi:formate C-acetyltransferase